MIWGAGPIAAVGLAFAAGFGKVYSDHSRTVVSSGSQDRLRNLAKRTGVEGVKSVCLALQQSERYGTPLAQSLRVMAQENRDMRMTEAEKKAAALPPKLTVPMIVFFLPVLFVVILGPTGIKIAAQMH